MEDIKDTSLEMTQITCRTRQMVEVSKITDKKVDLIKNELASIKDPDELNRAIDRFVSTTYVIVQVPYDIKHDEYGRATFSDVAYALIDLIMHSGQKEGTLAVYASLEAYNMNHSPVEYKKGSAIYYERIYTIPLIIVMLAASSLAQANIKIKVDVVASNSIISLAGGFK